MKIIQNFLTICLSLTAPLLAQNSSWIPDDVEIVEQKEFKAREVRDVTWYTKDIIPVAYENNTWKVIISSKHCGLEGAESPCAYKHPFMPQGLGESLFDGGLWIQEWKIKKGFAYLENTIELAAQVEGESSDCTSQEKLNQNFNTAAGNINGQITPKFPYWNLENLNEVKGYKYQQIKKEIEGKTHLLLIFNKKENVKSLGILIKTHTGLNYRDDIVPTVAVILNNSIHVFGLRKYGEKTGDLIWIPPIISVKPLYLGKLPF